MFHTIRRQLKLFLLITFGGPDQLRLLEHLLTNNRYKPIVRPVQNDSHTLPVTINLALQQIINFDGKNEAIVISGWMAIVCILSYNLGCNGDVPCFLISCMTLLGFLLSPDSGEKLTLRELEFHDRKFVLIHSKSSEITTLLSVVMFSLLLSEILPPSSTAIPIITVYFMCVMIMSAVSVVASVLVLSLHFRNSSNYKMSSWVDHISK
ncbi:unnamed protein product [Rotaria sp. Silwood1]|nr:unnamed protein product [Rotaria sp. Silwood1]CAF4868812.1 unnamed protein product [Rotaria sp. Silwood1]